MHPETNSPLPADRTWAARLNQWRLYAAAGGAAITAGTAEAQIIYVNPAVKPDAALPGAGPFNNANVAGNFTVAGAAASVRVMRRFSGTALGYGKVAQGLIGLTGNSSGGLGAVAKRFAPGEAIAIGATNAVGSLGLLNFLFPNGGPFANPQFNLNATGIAGFKLPAAQGGGFGWIRYSVLDRDNNGYVDEVKAIDWAYNSAGGGITALQGVPEPTSLALLSLGAAGVLAWRRQRAAATAEAAS